MIQGLRSEPDQFMGPHDQMMSDTRSEMGGTEGFKDRRARTYRL